MSDKIVISKFGGTSMADYTAMVRSAQVAIKQKSSIVFVSATAGTTNQLITLINSAELSHWNDCEKILFQLREKHFYICQKATQNKSRIINEQLRLLFNELETLIKGVFLLQECSPKAKDQILSFGERISSMLFAEVFKTLVESTSNTQEIKLLDIRSILITDDYFGNATALTSIIKTKCLENLILNINTIYITQGFIGATESGATTTLGRGGSDYSAALIAEAVNADILEIWTDVAGIATTDPRICQQAKSISEISYNEASEMTQYGAKILHPTTLVPAMRNNIPVFVGSSFDGEQKGTWIRKEVTHAPLIRAITKRDEQAILIIRTPKMLNAFGFMSKIFGVFEKYRISVDCVTTSEISVAVTIGYETLDNEKFINELRTMAEVNYEKGFALISLIGNNIAHTSGMAKNIFDAIDQLNVRMMCLGASDYNFNLLVKEDVSQEVVTKLHQTFIGEEIEHCTSW